MELKQLQTLLRESGVVGAGGAGFPTYAKLSDKADTLILNGAECEPLLRLHRQLLEEYTTEILTGLSELLTATGAKRGIIALKAHYTAAVRALEREIGEYPNLSIHTLDSVYPAGDELILIQEVTGRVVKPGSLPITVGVTVCNVETAYNVYRALSGQPVTHKYVTVTGEVHSPVTLRVPLGTRFSELIAAAGGTTRTDVALISGGPMMGALADEGDVVTRTTNAILVLPAEHRVILNKKRNYSIQLRRAMSVCCQCHSCTDLCSRHVLGYPVEPHMVMRVLSNGGRMDASVIDGAMFCSGCGLCEEYACPQDLSPKALIAEMKAERRRLGQKPRDDFEPAPISPDAAWKKVSVSRLTERLGLAAYDGEAPLQEQFGTKTVKLLLSQHIGAPATPTVAVGDRVRCGQTVAKAAESALSVDLHASLDGVVTAVTSKYIKLKTE